MGSFGFSETSSNIIFSELLRLALPDDILNSSDGRLLALRLKTCLPFGSGKRQASFTLSLQFCSFASLHYHVNVTLEKVKGSLPSSCESHCSRMVILYHFRRRFGPHLSQQKPYNNTHMGWMLQSTWILPAENEAKEDPHFQCPSQLAMNELLLALSKGGALFLPSKHHPYCALPEVLCSSTQLCARISSQQ